MHLQRQSHLPVQGAVQRSAYSEGLDKAIRLLLKPRALQERSHGVSQILVHSDF